MFFFFPVSTDAPVYYWPYGTIGLIIANVLVFVGMVAGVIDPTAGWVLMHGESIRPIEWLLSVFTHLDIFHLAGNMVFLWVFGLVVEGKLGWLRFLACYLAIGVGESAVEQVVMLALAGDEPSGSYGASTAIYGIMAMAAVWAPKNEIGIFYFAWAIMLYTGTIDVSIAMMAAFYIGSDLLWTILGGGAMSTSLLHVAGAAIGFPLAIVMLKRNMVDCEGWDMFHVWRNDLGGHEQKARDDAERAKQQEERRQRKAAELEVTGKEQVHKYLENGNADAAKKVLDKLGESGLDILLDEADLVQLIRGLHKKKKWVESAPMMAKLIRIAPDRSDPVRIKLAQICVVELNRPGRALDLLAEANLDRLPAEQQRLAAKIAQRAEAMQAAGAIELDDDQW